MTFIQSIHIIFLCIILSSKLYGATNTTDTKLRDCRIQVEAKYVSACPNLECDGYSVCYKRTCCPPFKLMKIPLVMLNTGIPCEDRHDMKLLSFTYCDPQTTRLTIFGRYDRKWKKMEAYSREKKCERNSDCSSNYVCVTDAGGIGHCQKDPKLTLTNKISPYFFYFIHNICLVLAHFFFKKYRKFARASSEMVKQKDLKPSTPRTASESSDSSGEETASSDASSSSGNSIIRKLKKKIK